MEPLPDKQKNNPLHGITLERVLTELEQLFGWERMFKQIPVQCFLHDPSVKSSLKFFRKTPWAREKLEAWYVYEMRKKR